MTDKTPVGPVHDHVTQLMRWGMDAFMISHATGEYVTNSTITNIANQHYGNVLTELADAVMAVGPQPVQYCPAVLSIGAQRRIWALARRGWTSRYVEAEVGLPHGTVSQIMLRRTVRYSTWKRIRDLYDPLSASPEMGPSLLAAERAKAKGWPTPMDWEVVDIDHPGQTPGRADSCRDFVIEERRERVAQLSAAGYTIAQIAASERMTSRMVERDREYLRRQMGVTPDMRVAS